MRVDPAKVRFARARPADCDSWSDRIDGFYIRKHSPKPKEMLREKPAAYRQGSPA
jgi:hypothetical protein